jgi:hypothetical protein
MSHFLLFVAGSILTILIIGYAQINLCQLFNNCTTINNLNQSHHKILTLENKVSATNTQCIQKSETLTHLMIEYNEFTTQMKKRIKDLNDSVCNAQTNLDKAIAHAKYIKDVAPIISDYIDKSK